MGVFGSPKNADGQCIIDAMPQTSRTMSRHTASYRVLGEAAPERRTPRRRVHLRSGKLIDARGGFLSEGRISDIGENGIRLVLQTATALPTTLQFYDDLDGTVRAASIVWQHDRTLGLALSTVRRGRSPGEARLGTSLYALDD